MVLPKTFQGYTPNRFPFFDKSKPLEEYGRFSRLLCTFGKIKQRKQRLDYRLRLLFNPHTFWSRSGNLPGDDSQSPVNDLFQSLAPQASGPHTIPSPGLPRAPDHPGRRRPDRLVSGFKYHSPAAVIVFLNGPHFTIGGKTAISQCNYPEMPTAIISLM